MLVAIREFHINNKLQLFEEPVLFADFSPRFIDEFGPATVDELKASLPSPAVVTEVPTANRRLRHRSHAVDEKIRRFLNRIGALLHETQTVEFKGTPSWAVAALIGFSLMGIALAAVGNCLNKTRPGQMGFGRNPHVSRKAPRHWKAGFSGGVWAG